MRVRERHHAKVSVVARAFVLVALLGPALWGRDAAAIIAILTVGAVWGLASIADWRQRLPVLLVTTIDAALVGVVCGFTINATMGVLGALAVPPFTAGLYRGIQGVALALSAQMTAVVAVAFIAFDGLDNQQAFGAFSWNMTGLGLGLVGVFLNSAMTERADPLAPYHYAQGLIRQLIDLSGGLDNGLDPVALGGAIVSAVRDDLPTSAVVVSVPRGDTLTPLVNKVLSADADLSECEDVAVEAWTVGLPVLRDQIFAFPLNSEAGTVAVVAGILSERVDATRLGVDDRIRRLMRRLGPSAVHLDTALLFAAFRDSATAEERRRLAREMHDGVAQDIASLGYLVDAIGAGVISADQAERLEMLRERISAIVAEIRRSVVNLRTSIGENESLGTAIGSIARNLSEVSGVPIHVTLNEHTQRLRPEVEGELFRIAQEAMNNAVRHAQASTIEVNCVVHAPSALITVTDNGRGLQQARPTSHGLHIMRERARLIGAALEIGETPNGGLTVSVRVPGNTAVDAPSQPQVHDKIGA